MTEHKVNVERIGAEILKAQDQIAELTEYVKNMKGKLSEVLPEGDSYDGDIKVNIYRNRRFDDATARKNLTPEQYALISVLKADSKKAAAELSEADQMKCKKEFDLIVKVDVADAN